MTLGFLVRQAVEARGEDYLTYPQRALFDRIGIRRQVLEPDPWGNFLLSGYDYGTARNWARLGMLYLQDGVWQGQRLLPEGFTTFVRTPAPAWKRKEYGGQFWVNGEGQWNLPRDAYFMSGAGGQHTFVVPSHDLVVVRMGHQRGRAGRDQDAQRSRWRRWWRPSTRRAARACRPRRPGPRRQGRPALRRQLAPDVVREHRRERRGDVEPLHRRTNHVRRCRSDGGPAHLRGPGRAVDAVHRAQRAMAYSGLLSYYGGYAIDEGSRKVTHYVEASTNPNWPGTDLVRYFEFADGGDTLKLSIRNAVGRTTGTLTWARIR